MYEMEKYVQSILIKKVFTIKDLSTLLGKQSQTIRKWEKKGIIPKCKHYGNNKWRQYNRKEFAEVLQAILNYNWQRETIYNKGYLQYIINEFKKDMGE